MNLSGGNTVLLTGASGGLGRVMAEAFARKGARLALVAHPGAELEHLRQSLAGNGTFAKAYIADLRDGKQRQDVLQRVRRDFGPVDVLVNNAGVEYTSVYHELTESQIAEVLAVNLEAPMFLTWHLLPEMLERRQGHIVNISSLAGKAGPACQEPYAATKAALVAFTASLRATYCGTGVSASVIVPGFVEAGIYARLKSSSGCSAPAVLAGCRPEVVAKALIKAIEADLPEVIVNRYPVRPLLALSALSPTLGNWFTSRMGVHEFFRKVIEARKSGQKTAGPDVESPGGLADCGTSVCREERQTGGV